ncbi:hypothetical protein FDB55_03515 [Clostridium botulinum]|nr:hypothetical protein [Clostridium botulinum]NFN20815.1 hypothetical protein [Clostridium botulinum]NFN42033.1 hypothetical protein [Clostridium botulinum]
MNCMLEFFANDKYKLLSVLKNNQIKIKKDLYIPLSQQEIADIAHFSKLKTNKIINELIDRNFLIIYKGKKGKYALTNKAYKVLEFMQETNI